MQLTDYLWLAKEFGFAGGLLAFVFWTESNNRKDRNRREDMHAAERLARLQADKEETESRTLLASSLSALATIITGRAPHV